LRAHSLIIGVGIFVLGAMLANVAPDAIRIVCKAIGLGAFGDSVVGLLQHLTEGLVVLFALAIYVERGPFLQLEYRLGRLQHELEQGLAVVRGELSAHIADTRRTLDQRLTTLEVAHVDARVARLLLSDSLKSRFGGKVGNLTNLLLPVGMGPVFDASIRIVLTDAPDLDPPNSDLFYMTYTGLFTIDQSDYVIGLVNSKGHQDRLRDDDAPIHEIFVLAQSDEVIDWSVEQIVRRLQLKLEYLADPQKSAYKTLEFHRLSDTSAVWQPASSSDEFPLVLIRAKVPREVEGGERLQVRLSYRLRLSKVEGFCFWAAARPIYLSNIMIDASQLSGLTNLKFERFLPNFDRTGTEDVVLNGKYEVTVGNWLLKAHGVILTWHPAPVRPILDTTELTVDLIDPEQ
jgi:hypothetical protein